MAIDFNKIRPTASTARPVDPIEIFQSCTISDGNVNELWLPQGDALRDFHANRSESDISIVLNTGAGKTLVGLLIAQSLVNESSRQVVYACASIQLIEQTREMAAGYGLDVTTYYRTEFSDDGYERAQKPCLTTYQAIFNGKTIFRQHDIAAVIFDDAHTADQILRDQFTLSIDRSGMSSAYEKLAELFADYHYRVGRSVSYIEMCDGVSNNTFWIPPNVVYQHKSEIERILMSSRLTKDQGTMFAWEHLRDHIDHCCFLLSTQSLTITPPFVPVSTLPYFSTDVRRVYLSATLNALDSFARTFGRAPTKTISSSTKAGKCERLVLFPSRQADEYQATADFLRRYKALIVVPTYKGAETWSEIANPPKRESVPDEVRRFRDSRADERRKLLLVGRYDGVDLPGNTCRILVIDGLPIGLGPLERYLWEQLRINNALRNTIASRLVQCFGRISRGMNDHGVVILTGERLLKWLGTERNLKLLPSFLRRQIELGHELSDQIEDGDLNGVASYCLDRNPEWRSNYKKYVDDTEEKEVATANASDKMMLEVALGEGKYMERLWDSNYQGAAKALKGIRGSAMGVSENTGAWHGVWLAYALERSGDRTSAEELYRDAHAIQKNVPRHQDILGDAGETVSIQVDQVARQILPGRGSELEPPKGLRLNLGGLRGGSSGNVEESLRYLGQYLGFESSRPDNEVRTGPDVLWIVRDFNVAICIEVKTNKSQSSSYGKKEVGQMYDHIQWVRVENPDIVEVVPMFVGPKQKATSSANPSEEMVVVRLESLKELGEKLESLLKDVASGALPMELREQMGEAMRKKGLLWPDLLNLLESEPIR